MARARFITHDLEFHGLLVDFYRAKPLLGHNSAKVKAKQAGEINRRTHEVHPDCADVALCECVILTRGWQ